MPARAARTRARPRSSSAGCRRRPRTQTSRCERSQQAWVGMEPILNTHAGPNTPILHAILSPVSANTQALNPTLTILNTQHHHYTPILYAILKTPFEYLPTQRRRHPAQPKHGNVGHPNPPPTPPPLAPHLRALTRRHRRAACPPPSSPPPSPPPNPRERKRVPLRRPSEGLAVVVIRGPYSAPYATIDPNPISRSKFRP